MERRAKSQDMSMGQMLRYTDYGARVRDGSVISKKVALGLGSHINECVTVSKGTEVGNFSSVGDNCYIGRDVIIGDNVEIGDHVLVGEGCFIGNGAEIGPGVNIEPGLIIGDKSEIECDSEITTDIPPNHTVMSYNGVQQTPRPKSRAIRK